jgi:hypothetical protein
VVESGGHITIHQLGHRIESHAKITLPGQTASTKPEHLSPWKRALDSNSSYRKNARPYGVHVEEFVTAVIKRGCGVIDTGTIYGVLGMDKTYTPQAINEACKLAMELEQPTYKAIRIFLRLQPTRFAQKLAKSAS